MENNHVEDASNHKYGGHEHIRDNKQMDIFSLNCLFLLFATFLMVGIYLLFTTQAGKSVLEAFESFKQIPVLMLILIFVAAPVSAIIGSKSEDYRDMFIVNAVFVFIAMVLYMHYQLSYGIIVSELPYILGFGVSFRVDPLTFLMLAAATFLWLAATTYGHYYIKIEDQNRNRFYFWILTAFGGVMGALMAADLLTMFLFFEVMYLSCYFLVAHNQSDSALKAGSRYLYMGVIGGLSMLLGICLLFVYTGTFNIIDIHEQIQVLWVTNQSIVILSTITILIGFAIKAAVFPFHFWLPDAHSNAPTPASAVLSGMVIKVYIFSLMKFMFGVLGSDITAAMGFGRILPFIAVIGMIMGSIFAIGNKDIKRMLAYSSVAQVGYMLLGIGIGTEAGFAAAMFHITTHALMKAALFLSAGAVILQKGKRDVREFQGLGYEMPVTMSVFTIGAMAMIGIPGLNGFMSKWYLAIAALDVGKPVYVLIIMLSSFLNAMYYLPIIITAFLNESKERKNVIVMDKLPNTVLVPLIVLAAGCIFFGLLPQIIMDYIESAIKVFY